MKKRFTFRILLAFLFIGSVQAFAQNNFVVFSEDFDGCTATGLHASCGSWSFSENTADALRNKWGVSGPDDTGVDCLINGKSMVVWSSDDSRNGCASSNILGVVTKAGDCACNYVTGSQTLTATTNRLGPDLSNWTNVRFKFNWTGSASDTSTFITAIYSTDGATYLEMDPTRNGKLSNGSGTLTYFVNDFDNEATPFFGFRFSTDTVADATIGGFAFDNVQIIADCDLVKPIIDVQGSTSICEGEATVLEGPASAASYQWFKDGVAISGATGQTFVATEEGDYTVVIPIECNAESNPVSIEVKDAPAVPNVSPAGPVEICDNSTIVLNSDQGLSYQWYKNGSAMVGETNQSLVVSDSADYVVEVRNANGCSSFSAIVEVSKKVAPNKPVISSPTGNELCPGEGLELFSSESGDLQWYLDGNLIPGARNTSYMAYEVGFYTVELTSSQSGCKTLSDEFEVVNGQGPAKPTITPFADTLYACQGSPVTFTSSAADGFQWLLDGAKITGATNQSYTAQFDGRYAVITYDNNLDCGARSDEVLLIFKQAPQPTATANGPTTFCEGQSLLVSSSPAESYQWYRNGIKLSGETNQTISVTGSGSYYVIVKNEFNCSGTSNAVNVTVNPRPTKPVIVPGGVVNICEGQSKNLSVSGSYHSFQWFKDGLPIQGANLNNYTATESGQYSVQVSSANNCKNNSDPVTVNVQPVPAQPTITANGPTGFCKGDQVVLTSSAATVYQWYLNGNPIQGANSRSYTATVTGDYTVAVTTGSGCSNESEITTVTVFVSDQPVISPSGPITVCSNLSTPLVSSYADGNQWYLDGVLIPGENNDTLFATDAGTYYVKVTINGCTDSSETVDVIEIPAPAKPDITPASDTANCFGTVMQLSTTATESKQWFRNGQPIQGASNSSLLISNSGLYQVRVIGANGCMRFSDSILVTFHFEEPAAIVEGNVTICSNETVELNANIENADSYTWFFNNQVIPNEFGNSITVADAGAYKFSATIDGCTDDSDPITVTVKQAPNGTTVTASPGTMVCPGEAVTLTSSAQAAYQWFKDGASISGANAQDHVTTEVGDYYVVVTNADGCNDTSAVVSIGHNSAPQISGLDVTNSLCSGKDNGSVKIYANQGVAPYTYSLDGVDYFASNTFNNLVAGEYVAYLLDYNDCRDTMHFTIEEDVTNLAVDLIISKPITCSGDANAELKAQAAGGGAGYQYSLNGGPFQGTKTFSNIAPGFYSIEVKDQNGCTAFSDTIEVEDPAPLSFTQKLDNQIICSGDNNGSITGLATGGVEPYEYSIDGGINYQSLATFGELSEGVYRLRVRDANGCVKISPRRDTIRNPAPVELISVIKQKDVDCFGDASGEIHVYATGGRSDSLEYSADGINWQWQDSVLLVPAGVYTVVVRDPAGCTDTAFESITVSQPQELTATANVANQVSCNGGSDGKIIVQALGGTPPLRYSKDGATWQSSPVIDSLSSGFVTIFIEDTMGCSETVSSFIFQPQAMTVSASIITEISCFGADNGSIAAVPSGGAPGAKEYSIDGGQTYQQANVFEGLGPGNYTITVKDKNGCTSDAPSVQLIEPARIIVATSKQNVSCFGANDAFLTINASGGTGGFEYSIDGGNTFTTQNDYQNIAPGNYHVVVRDNSGCMLDDGFYTITEPTEIVMSVVIDAHESCPGEADGQLTTFITGGTSPFTFEINGGSAQIDDGVYTDLTAGDYVITVTDASGCTDTTDTITISSPNAVILDTIITESISCNGELDGSILIHASGGENDSLAYSIDGVNYVSDSLFENLAAGNYFVTVKDLDNGCITATQTIQVIEPLELEINPQVINHVSCNGLQDGKIFANVTGGTAPYLYSIDGGSNYQIDSVFAGLSSGNYTLLAVDANGCTVTSSAINILNPPALSITAVLAEPMTCNGANDAIIQANGQGGTGVLEFSISDGTTNSPWLPSTQFTNLAAGIYQVSVRDENGCIQNAPVITIQNPPVLTFTAQKTKDVSCFGLSDGQIVANASGGVGQKFFSKDGGTNWQANGVFSNLAIGTYDIQVRDANECIYDTLITIMQPNPISITASVTNEDYLQQNGAIDLTVSGGNPPYTYAWTSGQTSQDIDSLSGSQAGKVYTVTVTDAKGCQKIFSTQVFTDGVGVEEYVLNQIEVYPNPASSFVNIEIPQLAVDLDVKIYNAIGDIVWSDQFRKGTSKETINLANWAKGVYMIRFTSDEQTKVESIIIQ